MNLIFLHYYKFKNKKRVFLNKIGENLKPQMVKVYVAKLLTLFQLYYPDGTPKTFHNRKKKT